MGLAKVSSGSICGVRAELVGVEADARATGMRHFKIVGLPESAVSEGRVRVETALQNSGYRPSCPRITVNLAPASLKKAGTAFDLPIALAILAAHDQPIEGLREGLVDRLVVGELALDGRVRGTRGGLAYALAARAAGLRSIVLPRDNAAEAVVVDGLEVIAVEDLAEAVEVLRGARPANRPPTPQPPPKGPSGGCLSDVKGQPGARRALEIAAAGGHNLLMVGPPGSGKTMLARRLPGICPPLTQDERVEVSVIHSLKGLLPRDAGLLGHRPFRAPHHSVSMPALVGGGRGVPCPGEVSLAHGGVLFLDELPEFSRTALESLRQPMELGAVTISRVDASVRMPAEFALVATMNPCPCGFHGSPGGRCTCTPHDVDRYQGRVSGPLLDRIDLQVRVGRVGWQELEDARPSESSAAVRGRVVHARGIQIARAAAQESESDGVGPCNARLDPAATRRHCLPPSPEGRALLRRAVDRYELSARGFNRLLKVSRTIADLAGSAAVEVPHLAEALQYRLTGRGPAAPAVPASASLARAASHPHSPASGHHHAIPIGASA